MPQLVGTSISRPARAPALTAFMAGVARSVAGANVTINFLLPGAFDTDRLRSNIEVNAKKQGVPVDQAVAARCAASVPAQALPGTRRRVRPPPAPFLCSAHAGYITGQEPADRRQRVPGGF